MNAMPHPPTSFGHGSRPPPRWPRWLGVLGVSVAGVTLGAATARAALRRVAAPSLPPVDKPDERQPLVTDIDAAMPTLEDFPTGWDQEDAGWGEEAGVYRFDYRVLRLRGPSDKCSPTPCTYVLVIAAQRRMPSKSTAGWGGFTTRERAYDEMSRLWDEYTVKETAA